MNSTEFKKLEENVVDEDYEGLLSSYIEPNARKKIMLSEFLDPRKTNSEILDDEALMYTSDNYIRNTNRKWSTYIRTRLSPSKYHTLMNAFNPNKYENKIVIALKTPASNRHIAEYITMFNASAGMQFM